MSKRSSDSAPESLAFPLGQSRRVERLPLSLFTNHLGANVNNVDSSLLRNLRAASIRRLDAAHVDGFSNQLERLIESQTDEARKSDLSKFRIRAELPPIAYDGSPSTARVLFLSQNPNYGETATVESHYQPHADWPLSIVGDHVDAKTREYYVDGVFRHLQDAGVSLQQISGRVLKIELNPWATRKWPKGSGLDAAFCRFPSLRLVASLVRSLLQSDPLVLIKSGATYWRSAVPELEPLIRRRVFVSTAPVGKWITEGTYPEAWEQLVQTLSAPVSPEERAVREAEQAQAANEQALVEFQTRNRG
jgi:hypothetical protein